MKHRYTKSGDQKSPEVLKYEHYLDTNEKAVKLRDVFFPVDIKFGDYTTFSPQEAYDALDDIKAQIREIVENNPNHSNFQIKSGIEHGYYDDCWFAIKVHANRPLNEKEQKQIAKTEKEKLARDKREFERLKKKFAK